MKLLAACTLVTFLISFSAVQFVPALVDSKIPGANGLATILLAGTIVAWAQLVALIKECLK